MKFPGLDFREKMTKMVKMAEIFDSIQVDKVVPFIEMEA
jgi:hypothetical protein